MHPVFSGFSVDNLPPFFTPVDKQQSKPLPFREKKIASLLMSWVKMFFTTESHCKPSNNKATTKELISY